MQASPGTRRSRSCSTARSPAPPTNVLIYATSNRRHLLPEYFAENLETKHIGEEVHPGESVEEKISLSERFGLWISFYPFAQDDYLAAVERWLAHFGVKAPASARDADERIREALQFALQRGSRSGRVAWQFARHWAGGLGLKRSEVRERCRPRRRGSDRARRRRRAARPATVRQAIRRILGISRRQARTRRDAGACAVARIARGARDHGATASPWLVQEFVYPHAHVELHFFRVRAFDGEPAGHDGQAFAWQDPHAIDVAPLLPANTRVLAALTLPAVYAITCASDLGDAVFVERLQRALAAGVRLIQVREPDRASRDALLSRA